jgi:glutamate racemase
MSAQPIGVFDSGYGGLTVFRSIKAKLPQYDYIYLGDNARAPYGSRSFSTVHEYTWECVQWLFAQGCPLVIVACNTASAKALRSIQQKDLPAAYPDRRVLGVIRPTAEVIAGYSNTGTVGILATKGTVLSNSYSIEIQKFAPHLHIYQQACPLWVPLIEAGEHETEGADFFIRKNLDEILQQSRDIDVLLLACTHYPLLEEKLRKYLPEHVKIVSQGSIVADSLADYLQRHPEMETRITKEGSMQFYSTDNAEEFDQRAAQFFGEPIQAKQVHL